MWNEIFAGVYFCGLAVFCVLWELIFAIRTDWCFLLGINFGDFRKYPVPSIDNIVVFINNKCASVFSEKKRPVVIEQTRFYPAKTSVSPRSSPLGTFRDVPPRETSPAAKSEEKRMFSQASEFKLEHTVFSLE